MRTTILSTVKAALYRGIRIPAMGVWANRPLTSWHHGDRVDPTNWPWYVLCRFAHTRIRPSDDHWRHKRPGQVGVCHHADRTEDCRPETEPGHWEQDTPRVYERFYLYTRRYAFDIDVKIQ